MKEQPKRMRPPTPIEASPLWPALVRFVLLILFLVGCFAGLVPAAVIYAVTFAVVLWLLADMRPP